MSRKQRMKNRRTAHWLRLNAHTCENCGERGGHWVNTEMPGLLDILEGTKLGREGPAGFWICPMCYGPDGRRIAPRDPATPE